MKSSVMCVCVCERECTFPMLQICNMYISICKNIDVGPCSISFLLTKQTGTHIQHIHTTYAHVHTHTQTQSK